MHCFLIPIYIVINFYQSYLLGGGDYSLKFYCQAFPTILFQGMEEKTVMIFVKKVARTPDEAIELAQTICQVGTQHA